jgi:hypothetical protein
VRRPLPPVRADASKYCTSRAAGKRPAGVRKGRGSKQPKRQASGLNALAAAVVWRIQRRVSPATEVKQRRGATRRSGRRRRCGRMPRSHGSTEDRGGATQQTGMPDGGAGHGAAVMRGMQQELVAAGTTTSTGRWIVGGRRHGGAAASGGNSGGHANSGPRTGRKRKRAGFSGARAVRRFAAFAAGACEEDGRGHGRWCAWLWTAGTPVVGTLVGGSEKKPAM